MASALPAPKQQAIDQATQRLPRLVTLLELVEAVADSTDDEQEIITTVISLLVGGRVALRGNFRGEPVERLKE